VTVRGVVNTVGKRIGSRAGKVVRKANSGVKAVIKVDVIQLAERAIENAKAVSLPVTSAVGTRLNEAATTLQSKVKELKTALKEQRAALADKASSGVTFVSGKVSPVASDLRTRLYSAVASARELAKTVPGGTTLVNTSDQLLGFVKDSPESLKPLLHRIHEVYVATYKLIFITKSAAEDRGDVEMTAVPAPAAAASASPDSKESPAAAPVRSTTRRLRRRRKANRWRTKANRLCRR